MKLGTAASFLPAVLEGPAYAPQNALTTIVCCRGLLAAAEFLLAHVTMPWLSSSSSISLLRLCVLKVLAAANSPAAIGQPWSPHYIGSAHGRCCWLLVASKHGELMGLLTTLQESLAAAKDPATRCLYRAHSELASFMPLDAAASCSNGITGADWRHQPGLLKARTVASTTQFAAQHPEMRDSETILR